MSLARFDGWEPTTNYTYEAGRMVSSTPEPEWTPEERGWMLALALYRLTRCPSCGRDVSVCTAEDAEGAYTAPPPARCHATTALLRAQVDYVETPQSSALLWHTVRKG